MTDEIQEVVKQSRSRNRKGRIDPEENQRKQGKRSFKKKTNQMTMAEVEGELNRMRNVDQVISKYYKDLMAQLKLLRFNYKSA